MFNQILLEIKNGHRLQYEEKMIYDHAIKMGYVVKYASVSQLQRKRIQLSPEDLVVGSIPFVKAGLKMFGKELPAPMPYPIELKSFLHRTIEVRSLNEVQALSNVFIKPVDNLKDFTGFVVRGSDDFRLHSLNKNKKLYTASVVNLVSEYRYYIQNDKIIGSAPYSGGVIEPDLSVVNQMLELMRIYELSAYSIDIGVLSTGETALVEVNDAFAIGFYGGLTVDDYLNMLWARWRQLSMA